MMSSLILLVQFDNLIICVKEAVESHLQTWQSSTPDVTGRDENRDFSY